MAAAAPNPNNNLILLAVIGIGAYWLMSRRGAMAATPGAYYGATGAAQAQTMENAARLNLINTGVRSVGGLLSGIFGGRGGGQANPIYYDALTNDGWAANNPGNVSAWDWWASNGTAGD